MGTTPRGYPYPADTDPIAAGAAAIQALATKVDAALGQLASGSGTVTVSNAITGSTVVTLPAGRFTTAPSVALGSTNSAWILSATAVSATSFTLNVRQYSATASTGSVTAYYVASAV